MIAIFEREDALGIMFVRVNDNDEPATVEECVERLKKVSPTLHEAVYPGMHG